MSLNDFPNITGSKWVASSIGPGNFDRATLSIDATSSNLGTDVSFQEPILIWRATGSEVEIFLKCVFCFSVWKPIVDRMISLIREVRECLYCLIYYLPSRFGFVLVAELFLPQFKFSFWAFYSRGLYPRHFGGVKARRRKCRLRDVEERQKRKHRCNFDSRKSSPAPRGRLPLLFSALRQDC